jgi:hypothetical protein
MDLMERANALFCLVKVLIENNLRQKLYKSTLVINEAG